MHAARHGKEIREGGGRTGTRNRESGGVAERLKSPQQRRKVPPNRRGDFTCTRRRVPMREDGIRRALSPPERMKWIRRSESGKPRLVAAVASAIGASTNPAENSSCAARAEASDAVRAGGLCAVRAADSFALNAGTRRTLRFDTMSGAGLKHRRRPLRRTAPPLPRSGRRGVGGRGPPSAAPAPSGAHRRCRSPLSARLFAPGGAGGGVQLPCAPSPTSVRGRGWRALASRVRATLRRTNEIRGAEIIRRPDPHPPILILRSSSYGPRHPHTRGSRDTVCAYQPTGLPWFWRSSHALSGAKYSSMAPASIVRSPVAA